MVHCKKHTSSPSNCGLWTGPHPVSPVVHMVDFFLMLSQFCPLASRANHFSIAQVYSVKDKHLDFSLACTPSLRKPFPASKCMFMFHLTLSPCNNHINKLVWLTVLTEGAVDCLRCLIISCDGCKVV